MRVEVNKNFATRDELDAYIRSTVGTDEKENKLTTIELTEKEAVALSLDPTVTIYGVKIKIKK